MFFLLSRLTANWGVGCSLSFNQFINKMQLMHYIFFDDLVDLAQLYFYWGGGGLKPPQALMTSRHCTMIQYGGLLQGLTLVLKICSRQPTQAKTRPLSVAVAHKTHTHKHTRRARSFKTQFAQMCRNLS